MMEITRFPFWKIPASALSDTSCWKFSTGTRLCSTGIAVKTTKHSTQPITKPNAPPASQSSYLSSGNLNTD